MSDWMPGAIQDYQSGGVGLDTSLAPRVVWHITWDALTNGVQPPFDNVANYLKNVGYCPNLMWDPFTGKIVQFYPASEGGRALAYNNQDGRVNIQIEVYFTPGVVRNGRTYNTVAETPCVGLDKILAWTTSLGVPNVWPLGTPQWSGNPRNELSAINTWNTKAGHYGHCNSPGDTHTDPGPMPDLSKFTKQPQEDTLSAKEVQEIKDHINAIFLGGYTWGGKKCPPLIDGIAQRVWSFSGSRPTDKDKQTMWNRIVTAAENVGPIFRNGQNRPMRQEIADDLTMAQKNQADIQALNKKLDVLLKAIQDQKITIDPAVAQQAIAGAFSQPLKLQGEITH